MSILERKQRKHKLRGAHTPGPYTYRRHSPGVDDYWQIVPIKDEKDVLASIFFWCDDDPASLERDEANARLFAAAPELLGALRAMLAAGPYGEEDYDAAAEMAIAAIAKAGGRSPFRRRR